jgi:hypothetical protein
MRSKKQIVENSKRTKKKGGAMRPKWQTIAHRSMKNSMGSEWEGYYNNYIDTQEFNNLSEEAKKIFLKRSPTKGNHVKYVLDSGTKEGVINSIQGNTHVVVKFDANGKTKNRIARSKLRFLKEGSTDAIGEEEEAIGGAEEEEEETGEAAIGVEEGSQSTGEYPNMAQRAYRTLNRWLKGNITPPLETKDVKDTSISEEEVEDDGTEEEEEEVEAAAVAAEEAEEAAEAAAAAEAAEAAAGRQEEAVAAAEANVSLETYRANKLKIYNIIRDDINEVGYKNYIRKSKMSINKFVKGFNKHGLIPATLFDGSVALYTYQTIKKNYIPPVNDDRLIPLEKGDEVFVLSGPSDNDYIEVISIFNKHVLIPANLLDDIAIYTYQTIKTNYNPPVNEDRLIPLEKGDEVFVLSESSNGYIEVKLIFNKYGFILYDLVFDHVNKFPDPFIPTFQTIKEDYKPSVNDDSLIPLEKGDEVFVLSGPSDGYIEVISKYYPPISKKLKKIREDAFSEKNLEAFIDLPHTHTQKGIFYKNMPPKLQDFINFKARTYRNDDKFVDDLYQLCAEIEYWFINTKQLEQTEEKRYPYMVYVALKDTPLTETPAYKLSPIIIN